MKAKILSFVLVFFVLASFFCFAASAATFQPIRVRGYVNNSGSYLSNGYITGFFALPDDYYGLSQKLFKLSEPAYLYNTGVDYTGADVWFWRVNFSFYGGFGFMLADSSYSAFKPPPMDYFTIQVTFVSYFDTLSEDSNGYLYDVSVFDASGALHTVCYHSEGRISSSAPEVIYTPNAMIYFGNMLGSNYWLGATSQDPVNVWFPQLFSAPVQADGLIYDSIGIFRPVLVISGGASGEGFPGGSLAPDPPDNSPEDPTSAFTRFANVLFVFAEGLFSIEFFDGFFTIGDVVGIVFALSLLTLFVKWFAGG